MGPCSSISMNGNKYFFTIDDDHTRFTWLFYLKNKSEARKCWIDFVEYISFKKSLNVYDLIMV